MKRLEQIREDLNNSLARLEEAVEEAESELEIDGVIQRFELMWKLHK